MNRYSGIVLPYGFFLSENPRAGRLLYHWLIDRIAFMHIERHL